MSVTIYFPFPIPRFFNFVLPFLLSSFALQYPLPLFLLL
ncbi:hypothetical protein ES288_D04G059400v1 [Gossypium darwinii]|uniref:Uncharacterized protein n=1 Tax=Gossypium darwinii TaxID=34276 RepID=A0A5D2CUF7_GOSDA|nr:hypothetical protein ES288_D04G059400v1 [Gossypium darwinii]